MGSLLSLALLVLVACGLPTPCDGAPDAAVVVGWNERVLANAQAEDKFLTLKGVRAAAMMHLAMHDALNSIDRRYAAYTFARPQLDEYLTSWLAAIPDGPPKSKAIEIGAGAAVAILAKRLNDRWNSEAVYTWQPMGPGVYAEFAEHSGTPQGFVFGAGWASVKPFVLRSPQSRAMPTLLRTTK
jgi:hypothetical protein